MRKLLLVLAVALWPCVAAAQMFGPAVFVAPPASGGYSGPGDQGVTLTDCWGAERCTVGYTGKLANVCLTTNHTTCGDVGYDTSGGIKTADLTSVGCTTDDTSCEFATFYSQYGGCNLVAASGHRTRVQSTTTRNGHVSVGVKDDADYYWCQESGSAISSATMMGIVSGEASFDDVSCKSNGGIAGTYAFGLEDQNGTTGNACQFGVYGTTTTVYSIVADSGATNHLSSGTSVPAGLYCAISLGSSSTTQAVINGTADTAANPGSAWNHAVGVAMGSTNVTVDSWLGDVDVWAYIANSTNSTNANTVAHIMAVFWTGSGSPKC